MAKNIDNDPTSLITGSDPSTLPTVEKKHLDYASAMLKHMNVTIKAHSKNENAIRKFFRNLSTNIKKMFGFSNNVIRARFIHTEESKGDLEDQLKEAKNSEWEATKANRDFQKIIQKTDQEKIQETDPYSAYMSKMKEAVRQDAERLLKTGIAPGAFIRMSGQQKALYQEAFTNIQQETFEARLKLEQNNLKDIEPLLQKENSAQKAFYQTMEKSRGQRAERVVNPFEYDRRNYYQEDPKARDFARKRESDGKQIGRYPDIPKGLIIPTDNSKAEEIAENLAKQIAEAQNNQSEEVNQAVDKKNESFQGVVTNALLDKWRKQSVDENVKNTITQATKSMTGPELNALRKAFHERVFRAEDKISKLRVQIQVADRTELSVKNMQTLHAQAGVLNFNHHHVDKPQGFTEKDQQIAERIVSNAMNADLKGFVEEKAYNNNSIEVTLTHGEHDKTEDIASLNLKDHRSTLLDIANKAAVLREQEHFNIEFTPRRP